MFDVVAEEIKKARYVIAFTGAGISAESGIPTFRDKGGIWDRYPPEYFGTPEGIYYIFMKNPKMLLEFISSTLDVFEKANPNKAHKTLSKLEEVGILKCVITQNIDNLHQEAGSKRVIEVHGNIYRLRCISCGMKDKKEKDEIFKLAREFIKIAESEGIQRILEIAPRCSCGGLMRPDVVLFTEPVQDIDIALEEAQKADVVISIGTSGVVYPAAYVPHIVKRNGGKIIEINPTGRYFPSDIYIPDKAQSIEKILEYIY